MRQLNPSYPLICSITLMSMTLLAACAGLPRQKAEEELRVATISVPEAERWRAATPKPGEAPEIVVPVYEQAELENGMRVIVSRRSDLPMVSINVAFGAGSSADPADKAGVAGLTYGLLLEGAAGMGAMEIADAFADLGSSPYHSVDTDGALIGVRVLKRNSDSALALIADVVRRPNLDQADFERRKRELSAGLQRRLGEPRWLASEALLDLVFGSSHPYGRPGSGTLSTIEIINIDDARAFYETRVAPAGSALVVTGDIDLDTAMSWARLHFGDWVSGEVASLPVPQPPATPRRELVHVVEMPGLQQTLIMLGRGGLAVGDDAELPLLLASQVFGGMFSSRLNQNLREDKGYTYGVFSRASALRGVGPIIVGSSVHAESTGAALKEIFAELASLRECPITPEELHAAREGITRSIPGWFETIEALASTGARLYWRDLPMNHYEKLITRLDAVTLEQVQEAALKYFDPDTMHIVLVGDLGTVEEQVPALGFGELLERAPDRGVRSVDE